MAHDTIVILDFGSQYSQLIARRVREVGVYSELVSWTTPAEKVLALNPKGFILSGGPNSVYDVGAPTLPRYVLESGLPVLGICYGMQLLAHNLGGKVAASQKREYGPANLQVDVQDDLFFRDWRSEIGDYGLASNLQSPISSLTQVWMSHGDKVEHLPPGFRPLAHSDNSPLAAAADVAQRYYAVQFHPEVAHTPQGSTLLRNFVLEICGCTPDWTPASFIEEQVGAIRAQVGNGRVVLGLSGGVDS
ncbi:MAG TPA: glutamine-hydrolyzing GMP synthase, partial [Chloroflexota bacterium]|nr:glutamine-hydrolyzing GMP synthase [Chloroflexota bacterium]